MRKIDYKEYVGKKYNRLTILSYAGRDDCGQVLVNCKCDCGNEIIYSCSSVVREKNKSCGCLKKEYKQVFIDTHKTHGHSKTRLYRIYSGMLGRCYNPNKSDYYRYGGRGINICKEWKNDYISFEKWALSNGYKNDLTIERKDINRDYSPENCCWVGRKEQARNREITKYIVYKGIKKPMSEWAEEMNISYWTLRSRRKLGWSDKEIIEGKKEVKDEKTKIPAFKV